MSTFRSLFLVLALTFFAGAPTSAQTVPFGIQGQALKVTTLVTFRSDPSEDELAFVARVGTFMDRFTRVNGFEACAFIEHVNGQMQARVSTVNSHIGCVVASTPHPDVTVGLKIHSHPLDRIVQLNQEDNVFLRGVGTARTKARQRTMTLGDGPSAIDRSTGSGYLIQNSQVLFYSGDQSEDRVIGPVAASPLFGGAVASNP